MDDRKQGMQIVSRMRIPSGAAAARARFLGETYDIPMTETALSKHVLFTGSIGSGKTTAMYGLLESVTAGMGRDDVMIVFDAKGDFRGRFYRPGRDCIISCTGEANVTWNLFREVEMDGPDRLDLNVMELVNSFFAEKIERSNAPFFPMAAKDILYGIIMYILRTCRPEDRTNEELYLYLQEASLDDVITCFEGMDDLRGLLDYISGGSGEVSDQTQGVYSELRTVVNELLIGSFRKAGNFSIRDFIRKKGGRILFVEYDLGIGSVLTPIYKAIFDLAIKETLCRTKSAGNVYFIIDEFSLLPNLYHISDGVNFGRSLGAKFIVAMQNCQQIIKAYGRENAYSILSAFGTLVSFRTSDRSTIEFIQDHFGTARTRLSYEGRDYRSGSRDTLVTGRVVEDYDILGLGIGEAIVCVSDYDPSPVRYKFKDLG